MKKLILGKLVLFLVLFGCMPKPELFTSTIVNGTIDTVICSYKFYSDYYLNNLVNNPMQINKNDYFILVDTPKGCERCDYQINGNSVSIALPPGDSVLVMSAPYLTYNNLFYLMIGDMSFQNTRTKETKPMKNLIFSFGESDYSTINFVVDSVRWQNPICYDSLILYDHSLGRRMIKKLENDTLMVVEWYNAGQKNVIRSYDYFHKQRVIKNNPK